MKQLAGYWVEKLIYEGARTLVYRGVDPQTQESVILKKLRKEYPTFNELLQFRHQYVITKNLDLPGIVKPVALEKDGNGYVLVMEDVGGISLSEYYRERSLSVEEFLTVAIAMSKILAELDRNRIIHKDIKPSNVLINPDTLEIFLIDFSISSLLPRETQTLQSVGELEGTLAYISPEQTGRMNRGIDYRSDFYSLGVTFYELLTGQLPFNSEDAMELVHCHIAKMPEALGKRQKAKGKRQEAGGKGQEAGGKRGGVEEIPEMLSDIVLKLMAKAPEERYQSAKGLERDLSECWQQWQKTGKIEDFELGRGDKSDRFIIPEKLYGRETEVKTLLEAFDRIANPERTPHTPHTPHTPQPPGGVEMMLVAGFSGIGKTAVVSEVHKPIVEKRGYFISGKFDQFNRNIPLSAFVIAFRDLIGQLLGESDAAIKKWKKEILSVLGEQAKVIVEVIPELENIIGEQPEVSELSGSAAQNRFNLLFGKFLRVFTTKEHPLVIFLDDLQWADSASLSLLKLLMNESESGYLLILGAYRDNEVYPGHPLMLTLEDIGKTSAPINTITLTPLPQSEINRLVADTLSCSLDLALPLTELVYQKTKGNPFFTNQFLKSLHEDGWIEFNVARPEEFSDSDVALAERQELELGYWQCDITKVRELSLTDDVVEFMASRIAKLPEATRSVLKLAACIGNQFDLETLAIVNEQSPTEAATNLWVALREGLVLPLGETYKFYRGVPNSQFPIPNSQFPIPNSQFPIPNSQFPTYKFLHDRVQQAAYSLIPEERKKSTHWKIGQLLSKNIPPEQREEKIFEIVDRLNLGRELIPGPSQGEELARLNWIAGKKAKLSAAYKAAGEYLAIAVQLLPENSWKSQYDLTLNLYLALAEIEYINTNFQRSRTLIEATIEGATDLLDRLKAYEILVQMQTAENKLEMAVETGLQILEMLGIAMLESSPTDFNLEAIENLPEMKEPGLLAALRTLIKIAAPAYNAKPKLIPSIAMTMVDICTGNGNSSLAAYSYAFYGMLLCSALDNIPLGYQFGRLALQVLERFEDRTIKGEVHHLFNVGIRHWQEAASSTLEPWRQTIQFNRESGNIGYVCYAAMGYCINLFLSGNNLENASQESQIYLGVIQKEKQDFPFYGTVVWVQVMEILRIGEGATKELKGELFDAEKQIPILLENQNLQTLFSTYLIKGMLCYLFGDYREAVDNFNSAREYQQTMAGLLAIAQYPFYESLAIIALYPQQKLEEQNKSLAAVENNQNRLARWAENAPMNFQHKWDLVAAEKAKILGQNWEAVELYEKAIAGAKENGYIQEEALANEVAAQFYLDSGKEKIARTYLIDAYYCYSQWGARAKVADLEKRYGQLLASILQSEKTSLATNATISSMTEGTVTSTSTGTNILLDFASAFKASLAIACEIELERLLWKLMEAVMENAGATKSVLLLSQVARPGKSSDSDVADAERQKLDTLVIEAVAGYSEEGAMVSLGRSLPVNSNSELPQTIVNTVKRTREALVINDYAKQARFASDVYLVRYQPKSILCLPLLDRGQLRGILYLENQINSGVFTSDRLELLKVFAAQAAISLQNARLYQDLENANHTLEEKVAARTIELNDNNKHLLATLAELKHTQAQLIHTEKMSSLGRMVAGVAHEINNPTSFIQGNISPAWHYFEDLLEILKLYEEECPDPSSELQEKIEELDLEYLTEDLNKIFGSMRNGCDRIRNIVRSLRTFSRLDEAKMKVTDLQADLESAIMLLENRLLNSELNSPIAVIKAYGNLPQITCYPAQVNQVFFHIISNSIDALCSHAKSPASDPPTIKITTETLDGDKVKITISDNGEGMNQETQRKIFDPFFTTKPVGQGTGLGLSTSYQIIVGEHGGDLTCSSELGKGTEFVIILPVTPLAINN